MSENQGGTGEGSDKGAGNEIATGSVLAGGDGAFISSGGGEGIAAPVVGEWAASGNDATKLVIEKQGWQDLDAAITSYNELRTHMDSGDRGGLQIPASRDDVDGWVRINQELGMPKTAEEYEFKEFKPAEGQLDLSAVFPEFAHKVGMSQHNAAEMNDLINDHTSTLVQTSRDEFSVRQTDELSSMMADWGDNGKANLALAKKTAVSLGMDDAMLETIERQVGTRVLLEKMLLAGRATGSHNDGGRGGDGLGGPETLSREAAQDRLATFKADKVLTDKYLDGDAAAVAEFNKLNQAASSNARLSFYSEEPTEVL